MTSSPFDKSRQLDTSGAPYLDSEIWAFAQSANHLPQNFTHGTSLWHAIWSKVSGTCFGPYPRCPWEVHAQPPISAIRFRIESIGSDSRLRVTGPCVADLVESFGPKLEGTGKLCPSTTLREPNLLREEVGQCRRNVSRNEPGWRLP